MPNESETHRFSLEHRLTKIEALSAQLVLDHAGIKNTLAELRKIVSILQNFKLTTELRAKDAKEVHDTRAQKTMWKIGIMIAAISAVIQIVAIFAHK